ncbi:MAG: YlmH/Sll1252 family protein [Aerococcaceae bacterium]|nr:YlmH/Sll1252 family protein [Aerococcaceae bacterium]
MSQAIYQHYRPSEKHFIDQVLHWLTQVETRYAPMLTPFLTPREAQIVTQLTGRYEDIQVAFHGLFPEAERQRALFYPSYMEAELADFQLTLIEVKFALKFAELTHQRILGTVLSTGLERNRIGDIVTDGTRWQFVVDEKVASFLQQQVTKVASHGVQLEITDVDNLIVSSQVWQTETVVSSALRLDAVLAKVYAMSRQNSKERIQAGHVKVNFVEVLQPDFELGMSDLVSVRKYGRFIVQEMEGMTKKDNYRLKINKLSR